MESSNSSYVSYSNSNSCYYAEEEEEKKRSSSSSSLSSNNNKKFYSSLHAVRKPLILKKPIAPFPPVKPKVYKVDPTKFKEVVQRLTAAVEVSPDDGFRSGPRSRPRRLDHIAPPPLDLMISTMTPPPARTTSNCFRVEITSHKSSDQDSLNCSTNLNNTNTNILTRGFDDTHNKKVATANKSNNKYLETCGALSPLGLGFNFSPTWSFSQLLSPGTLSSLEHTTVL